MLTRAVLLVAMITLAGCGHREIPLPALVAQDAGPTDGGFGATVTINTGPVNCTAGHQLEIACGCDLLGFCSGAPEIYICTPGTTVDDCSFGIGVVATSTPCGECAGVTFTCPASGGFVVATSGAPSDECFMEGHSR